MGSVHEVPQDCLESIFLKLDSASLSAALLVCRDWNRILSEFSFLRQLFGTNLLEGDAEVLNWVAKQTQNLVIARKGQCHHNEHHNIVQDSIVLGYLSPIGVSLPCLLSAFNGHSCEYAKECIDVVIGQIVGVEGRVEGPSGNGQGPVLDIIASNGGFSRSMDFNSLPAQLRAMTSNGESSADCTSHLTAALVLRAAITERSSTCGSDDPHVWDMASVLGDHLAGGDGVLMLEEWDTFVALTGFASKKTKVMEVAQQIHQDGKLSTLKFAEVAWLCGEAEKAISLFNSLGSKATSLTDRVHALKRECQVMTDYRSENPWHPTLVYEKALDRASYFFNFCESQCPGSNDSILAHLILIDNLIAFRVKHCYGADTFEAIESLCGEAMSRSTPETRYSVLRAYGYLEYGRQNYAKSDKYYRLALQECISYVGDDSLEACIIKKSLALLYLDMAEQEEQAHLCGFRQPKKEILLEAKKWYSECLQLGVHSSIGRRVQLDLADVERHLRQ